MWKVYNNDNANDDNNDNGQFVIRKGRKYLSHIDKSIDDWTTQLINRL